MPTEASGAAQDRQQTPQSAPIDSIKAARTLQLERSACFNRDLDVAQLELHCALDASEARALRQAAKRLNLSARGIHRTQRIARTIADLDGEPQIQTKHLTEALSYRGANDPLSAGADALH